MVKESQSKKWGKRPDTGWPCHLCKQTFTVERSLTMHILFALVRVVRLAQPEGNVQE